jgi:hypothetical protein
MIVKQSPTPRHAMTRQVGGQLQRFLTHDREALAHTYAINELACIFAGTVRGATLLGSMFFGQLRMPSLIPEVAEAIPVYVD